MKKSAFIFDGYTESGTLKETQETPEVNFKYRPPVGAERTMILNDLERIAKPQTEASNRAAADYELRAVLSHLVEWDIVDAAGAPVEISEANLRRVHASVFNPLSNWVLFGPPNKPAEKQEAADAKN